MTVEIHPLVLRPWYWVSERTPNTRHCHDKESNQYFLRFLSDYISNDARIGGKLGPIGWAGTPRECVAMAAIQRLLGKTAIVTASTAGIGFAIARRLARGDHSFPRLVNTTAL
jgi:hypothetical protein